MQRRLKILITANHCAPDKGSEHGVGWNFLIGISRFHDVILVCNDHDYIQGVKDYINSEEGKQRNIQLFLIKQKVKYTKINRFFPFTYYRDYKKWQKNVFYLVKELIKTEPIDIIHHVTNITFREPGFLWQLDKPFIWGPVGILGDEPIRFFSFYSFKEKIKMIFRRLSCIYQLNHSSRLKKAAQKADICICISNHVAEVMRQKLGAAQTAIIQETGVILKPDHQPLIKRESSQPIQLLWLGRFDSSKGAIFLIEALKLIEQTKNINYKLILVGDGDQRQQAIRLCEANHINYEYKGYIPYQEVPQLYAQSHLFFLTSLMDATTTVVFEALANGCPVIALNHLSFSEVIDETCGRKIELINKKQIISNIAEHIRYYYHHEDERYQLSLGAIKKAETYSWENKIDKLNKIYYSIIEDNSLSL